MCKSLDVPAGTSDRVFQRGSIAPSRGDFSSGKLPRGARNRRIYARFVSVGARTPFKGRSTNIGFPFSRES